MQNFFYEGESEVLTRPLVYLSTDLLPAQKSLQRQAQKIYFVYIYKIDTIESSAKQNKMFVSLKKSFETKSLNLCFLRIKGSDTRVILDLLFFQGRTTKLLGFLTTKTPTELDGS